MNGSLATHHSVHLTSDKPSIPCTHKERQTSKTQGIHTSQLGSVFVSIK